MPDENVHWRIEYHATGCPLNPDPPQWARSCLRRLLCLPPETGFGRDAFGAIKLDQRKGQGSLSHKPSVVCSAWGDSHIRVGVDVETDVKALATLKLQPHRWLRDGEKWLLHTHTAGAMILWTIKEAACKAGCVPFVPREIEVKEFAGDGTVSVQLLHSRQRLTGLWGRHQSFSYACITSEETVKLAPPGIFDVKELHAKTAC